MNKTTNKSLNDSKKKDLTQTLLFSVSPDLKTTSRINIFKMVCEGKITQIHEFFHNMIMEGKRQNKSNINEEIKNIINSQDPQGKTPLFYAV